MLSSILRQPCWFILLVQFPEAESDPGSFSAASYNEWTGDSATCSRDAILGFGGKDMAPRFPALVNGYVL